MSSKFALRKKPDYIISEEAATDQVVALLEYYDIDVEKAPESAGDEGGLSPRDALERALEQLTDYARRGLVEISTGKESKITVKQTLTDGSEIEYREVNARAKLAMDRVKGKGYSRLYALMASLANLPPAAIEKLPPRDLAVVEVLGSVFSNA
jgi:hypothetical protein